MSGTLVDWWYEREPPWMVDISTGPVGPVALHNELTLHDIGGATRARPPKASIPLSSVPTENCQYQGPEENFKVTHLPPDYYERCPRCGTSITFKEVGPRNYPLKKTWCDDCYREIEAERHKAEKERIAKIEERRRKQREYRQRRRQGQRQKRLQYDAFARSVGDTQHLVCTDCNEKWTRPKQVGRPPEKCPSCKEDLKNMSKIPDELFKSPHYRSHGQDEHGTFVGYDDTEENLAELASQVPGWTAVLNTIRPTNEVRAIRTRRSTHG